MLKPTHWERVNAFRGEAGERAKQEVARYGWEALSRAQAIVDGYPDQLRGVVFLNSLYERLFGWAALHELEDRTDLPALCRHEGVARIAGKLLPYAMRVFSEKAAAEESLRTMITSAWSMTMHEVTGRKVYEVSPGLAQQLRNTELRGLATDDLTLPFQCVYIVVPPEAGLTVWNSESGEHAIEGVYVIEAKFDGKRVWAFMAAGEPKNNDPTDDALFYFSLTLEPGEQLDSVLARSYPSVREGVSQSAATGQQMKDRWLDIFKWTMNAMMYATWPDVPNEDVIGNEEARRLWDRMQKMPKSKKRDELKGRFNVLNPQRRIYLGRGIKPEPLAESESSTVRKITVRTHVPAHWQYYWIGKGRTEKIWKRVAPYWRGPKDGEVSNPRHVLT